MDEEVIARIAARKVRGPFVQLHSRVQFELNEVRELKSLCTPEVAKMLEYFVGNIEKQFARTLTETAKEIE